MDQKKIGEVIAECRKNKKMTQQELADKLSVSNRTISNWENGKYLPDYSVLIPLTEVLEITIVELIYGEKQKTEDSSDELDLLSDLKGNENTIVTTPIEATFDNVKDENTTADLEKTLARADKNFYTDSNMFTKKFNATKTW